GAGPSRGTGLGDLPHPALRLVVLPTMGLTGQSMGMLQAEEPVLGKEDVGPSPMVVAACNPVPSAPTAQQASQPTAYPAVEITEDTAMAVLVVAEPAAQNRIEVIDDRPQAGARGATGLCAKRILQLPLALVARPATAALEAVAQELEALCPRVDYACLVGMQRQ